MTLNTGNRVNIEEECHIGVVATTITGGPDVGGGSVRPHTNFGRGHVTRPSNKDGEAAAIPWQPGASGETQWACAGVNAGAGPSSQPSFSAVPNTTNVGAVKPVSEQGSKVTEIRFNDLEKLVHDLKSKLELTSTAPPQMIPPVPILNQIESNRKKIELLERKSILNKIEVENLDSQESPYLQIEQRYPTIRNFPAFFLENKHNPKRGKLIFANDETKTQFLKNEAINNEMRINMKGQGIILNDFIPAKYHFQKYCSVAFMRHLKENKIVSKSKLAMDRYGLKTGFFIDSIGRNKDGAWRFSRDIAPSYSSYKELTDFGDFQPPNIKEYMLKFPNYLTKVKVSKNLHQENNLSPDIQEVYVIPVLYEKYMKNLSSFQETLARERGNEETPPRKLVAFLTVPEFKEAMAKKFPNAHFYQEFHYDDNNEDEWNSEAPKEQRSRASLRTTTQAKRLSSPTEEMENEQKKINQASTPQKQRPLSSSTPLKDDHPSAFNSTNFSTENEDTIMQDTSISHLLEPTPGQE